MKVENSLVKIEDRGEVVDVTFKDLPFGCRTLTREVFDALAEAISMCKNSAPERGPITIEHPTKFLVAHQHRLTLHDYEIDALIAWHRDQQHDEANREQYVSAADHKRRREELEKMKGGGK